VCACASRAPCRPWYRAVSGRGRRACECESTRAKECVRDMEVKYKYKQKLWICKRGKVILSALLLKIDS